VRRIEIELLDRSYCCNANQISDRILEKETKDKSQITDYLATFENKPLMSVMSLRKYSVLVK
jgi:hypothetical protein